MLNIVSIGGRPTAEPQMHVTNGGTPYATFRLANPSGRPKANFITVECWGKLVSTALSRVHKGVVVLVTGEIRHREWHDEHGKRHERITVKAQALYSFDRSVVPEDLAALIEDQHDDLAA